MSTIITTLSSTAVSLILIIAGFFFAGLFCGYILKINGHAHGRSVLFWWALAAMGFYQLVGLVLSRKVLHETITESLLSTLSFREVPALAGLFLSISLLLFAGCILAPKLLDCMEDDVAKKRCLLASVILSAFLCLVTALLFHVMPGDFVWGGAHYSLLGLLAFSCFYLLGVLSSKRLPTWKHERKHRDTLHDLMFDAFHRHPVLGYFIIYTGTFCALSVLVFSYNKAKDVGFIWQTDAMPQYIPYMQYTADYLRELAGNLLHGDFTLKMYDFTIGMGDDVRSVLRMRPLEFLAAFFPSDLTIPLYSAFILLRFWISGITFSMYCRYKEQPWFHTLIGSMIYVFSGYTLRYGAKHPVFMLPMILLPLLLIAMERLIKREGYLFFTFLVGISLFINYYFLYMTTVFLGIYTLIRFPKIYRKDTPVEYLTEFGQMMGRITCYYLLGVGLGMCSFLPTAIRTLNSERVGASKTIFENLLCYKYDQPFRILLATISGQMTAKGAIYLSFSVIALPAIVILFIRPAKEYWELKLVLILEFIGMLLPVFGLAMSLFSSITNRWVYVVAFTVAYTVVCVAGEFKCLTRRQITGLVLLAPAYILAFRIAIPHLSKAQKDDIRYQIYFLCAAILLILLLQFPKQLTRHQALTVISLCTAISIGANGRYLYSNDFTPYIREFISDEKMEEYFQKDEFLHLAKIEDDSFYRCEAITERDFYENCGLTFGYSSTSMYNSVINGNWINYHQELDSSGLSAVHRIYSMDGRTAMDALANVRYYLATAENPASVPYGYEKSERYSYGEFNVYENRYPLALGYTYDSVIPRSDYEKLTPLERQQVMLTSAVVADEYADKIKSGSYEGGTILSETTKLLSADGAATIQDNLYTFEESEAGFTLSYQKKAGYETYLYLENLETESARAKIFINTPDMEKILIARNNNAEYSLGRNDYLVNLGYSEESKDDTISFRFVEKGIYQLDDARILYVPMDGYEEQIAARNKQSLTDVSIGTNTVTGSITTSGDKLLTFSIPYSMGWKAYVDGKEAELLKVNTAYMGCFLETGEHDIRLEYETPGLKIGTLITLISAFASIGICIMTKRRRQ